MIDTSFTYKKSLVLNAVGVLGIFISLLFGGVRPAHALSCRPPENVFIVWDQNDPQQTEMMQGIELFLAPRDTLIHCEDFYIHTFSPEEYAVFEPKNSSTTTIIFSPSVMQKSGDTLGENGVPIVMFGDQEAVKHWKQYKNIKVLDAHLRFGDQEALKKWKQYNGFKWSDTQVAIEKLSPLAVLNTVLPKAQHVGILMNTKNHSVPEALDAEAKSLGFSTELIDVSIHSENEVALGVAKSPIDAFYIPEEQFTRQEITAVLKATPQVGVPTFTYSAALVPDGALAAPLTHSQRLGIRAIQAVGDFGHKRGEREAYVRDGIKRKQVYLSALSENPNSPIGIINKAVARSLQIDLAPIELANRGQDFFSFVKFERWEGRR